MDEVVHLEVGHAGRYLDGVLTQGGDQVAVAVSPQTVNEGAQGGQLRHLQHRTRALCMIKLLPVTHVLVDTWMLTVKTVYKLSDVPDDQKWATNTHMTPFTLSFKA